MGVLLKRRVMHTVLYVISIVIALITGFPFLFLVINSFKGMGEDVYKRQVRFRDRLHKS